MPSTEQKLRRTIPKGNNDRIKVSKRLQRWIEEPCKAHVGCNRKHQHYWMILTMAKIKQNITWFWKRNVKRPIWNTSLEQVKGQKPSLEQVGDQKTTQSGLQVNQYAINLFYSRSEDVLRTYLNSTTFDSFTHYQDVCRLLHQDKQKHYEPKFINNSFNKR